MISMNRKKRKSVTDSLDILIKVSGDFVWLVI